MSPHSHAMVTHSTLVFCRSDHIMMNSAKLSFDEAMQSMEYTTILDAFYDFNQVETGLTFWILYTLTSDSVVKTGRGRSANILVVEVGCVKEGLS